MVVAKHAELLIQKKDNTFVDKTREMNTHIFHLQVKRVVPGRYGPITIICVLYIQKRDETSQNIKYSTISAIHHS